MRVSGNISIHLHQKRLDVFSVSRVKESSQISEQTLLQGIIYPGVFIPLKLFDTQTPSLTRGIKNSYMYPNRVYAVYQL